MRGAQVEVLHVWHLPYVGLPGVSRPYPDDEFEAYASAVLDHVITAAGEVNGSLERRVAKPLCPGSEPLVPFIDHWMAETIGKQIDTRIRGLVRGP